MAIEKKTKKQNPVRFRAARVDASVGTIARSIEKNFKLPEGSVRLVLPTGRKAHVDGKISNLLKRWDS